jgi:hypothetical protein
MNLHQYIKSIQKFFIITIIIIALLSTIVVILKANIQRREKLELRTFK